MLCGIKLGGMIWGVGPVLHLKALEIGLFLILLKKITSGRQYFNEELHAIL